MTSSEDFPDEALVPPIVLNEGDLPLGSIVTVDKTQGNELRLGITVRDDNIDDELEVRAKLSTLGEGAYDWICAGTIAPSLEPKRKAFPVILVPSGLRDRLCTRVDIFVSAEFARDCPPLDDEDRELFDRPLHRGDLARAQFWIWEMSGNPLSIPTAAQAIVSSCETRLRAQTTPPMQMVP